MPENILQITGTVAGVGGLALGILLLIYRDFIRNFIQARIFKTLSSAQATGLLGAVIVFTFSIAIIGIFAGFVPDRNANSFVLLVGVILLFIFVALFVVLRYGNSRVTQTTPSEKPVFVRVLDLIQKEAIEDAEKELTKAVNKQSISAEFWYLKSRIADARGNEIVAANYVNEALKRNPKHAPSLALKIRLLLLNGSKSEKAKAKELAEKSYGISDDLDVWLNCLKAQNMFATALTSNYDLDTKCMFSINEEILHR